jgi:hypothetical protein
MANAAQHDLAVHSQPGAEVFLKDYNWGPAPFRSYELTGYRWRHMIKPGVNETGLYPLGHAILIAPDESQLSDIIALPEGERDKELMNMTVGKIVEVGPSAWMDEPVPRAFPGEMVYISKFAGAIVVGKDGRPYRMVNADDVYCRRDADWPKRKVLEAPRVERREKKENYDE